MKKLYVLICLISLCTQGCVAWRSGIDPHAAPFTPIKKDAPAAFKSLSLRISAEHEQNKPENNKSLTERYEKDIIRTFKVSGLFSDVAVNNPKADLDLALNIIEKEDFNKALITISALTMLVFPCMDTVSINVAGDICNSQGVQLGKIKVSEEFSVVMTWLCLPAIPSFFVVQSRVRDDIANSILTQIAKNKKIWQSTASAPENLKQE